VRMTLIILSTFLSFIGCLTDSSEKLLEPKAVSATIIKGAIFEGRTITFSVVCEIPEPCWRFAGFSTSTSGQSITTVIFAQRMTNDPCLQVLSSIEAPVTSVVPSSGVYTFRFWQYNGETLDTTLTIP